MLQKNKKQNLSLSNNTHKLTPSKQTKQKQIHQHSKTNSNNESNKINTNKIPYQSSLYNTHHTLYHTPAANTEVIINLVLSKVDLPKIRRSTSIPVVINNYSRLSNVDRKCSNLGGIDDRQRGGCQGGGDEGWRVGFVGEEEEEGGEEDEVLSPRKVRRCTVSNFQQVKSKACSKQKIVILSTSRLNPESNIKIKHPTKTKILTKLNSKTSTLPNQSQPHHHNLQLQNTHSMPPIQLPSNTSHTQIPINLPTTPTADEQKNHNKVMKDIYKIVKKVKMQEFIEGDRQLLKLFPAIDLQLLVVKIKNEEILRKSVGIAKWSHFDYCNLKDL